MLLNRARAFARSCLRCATDGSTSPLVFDEMETQLVFGDGIEVGLDIAMVIPLCC